MKQVLIKDKYEKVLLESTDQGKNPVAVANKYAKKYPNGFITITWENGKHYQIAQNMVKDQEAVGNGEMNINKFVSKWYPGNKLSAKDITSELEEEFGKEDETF